MKFSAILLKWVSLSSLDDDENDQSQKYDSNHTSDQGFLNASARVQVFTLFTGEVRRLAGYTPGRSKSIVINKMN